MTEDQATLLAKARDSLAAARLRLGRWARFGLLAAAMAVTGGCSSAEPLSVDAFIRAIGRLNCEVNARCGSISRSSEASCEAALETSLEHYPGPYLPAEAIAAGRVRFDGDAARRCLDAIESVTCGFDGLEALTEACADVAVGLVAVGGTCFSPGECVEGAWCDQGELNPAGCEGTCVEYAATGDPCDLYRPCSDADYCLHATARCTPRAGLDEPCLRNEPCRVDLHCIGHRDAEEWETPPTPEVAGTCRPRGASGDPCIEYLIGTSCQPDLYCDESGERPVCAHRKGTGEACQDYDTCGDGLTCMGWKAEGRETASGTAGKCAPFLDEGEPCDPSAMVPGCPGRTLCNGGRCEPIERSLGESCSPFEWCRDLLYCDATTRTCVTKVAYGAECVPPAADEWGGALGEDPCYDSECDPATKTCSLLCSP